MKSGALIDKVKADFTSKGHTPYANMADHPVVVWNELYESETSWASVLCFDKLPQKSLASFAI